jgi:hypothetical protein
VVGRLGSDIHLFEAAEVIAFHAEGGLVFVLTSGASRRCRANAGC